MADGQFIGKVIAFTIKYFCKPVSIKFQSDSFSGDTYSRNDRQNDSMSFGSIKRDMVVFVPIVCVSRFGSVNLRLLCCCSISDRKLSKCTRIVWRSNA